MNNTPSTQTRSNVALSIVIVVAVCAYALLLKAYEVNNWRGFWFSLAHVVIVALGTWLALRKAR